jgi:acetyl-CoA acyltransferase 1
MNRLQVLSNHFIPQLSQNNCSGQLFNGFTKSPNDAVIVAAFRTPVTKARKGGLKDTDAVEMLSAVFKSVLDKTRTEGGAIGDIVIGSVLGPSSQRANEVRMASLVAGIPQTVPCYTVNRQCSSGLQAIINVANNIKLGLYEIGIAGGVETMTRHPMSWEGSVNENVMSHPIAKGCLIPMGNTAENLANMYNISRRDQDDYAYMSHMRATNAQLQGRFDDEIVPINTKYIKDDGTTNTITVKVDDGVRQKLYKSDLANLKPAFTKDGSVTAGNSSQVSDGASAVLLMSRQEAEKRGLEILAVVRTQASVGVPPHIMGVGAMEAVKNVLQKTGIDKHAIGLYEINEAFAAVALYAVKGLGLEISKVNVNGGAIAHGHALGNSGSRLTTTLVHEMKKRNVKYGIVSLCIGSGMGLAVLFERE